jgi:hypothetical protein
MGSNRLADRMDWGAVGFSLWMLSPFLALFAFVAFVDLAMTP